MYVSPVRVTVNISAIASITWELDWIFDVINYLQLFLSNQLRS